MINMKKMNKKQAGFTLIELVMVIVILGILSAFALPRFADLGGDARKATVKGAFGAIKAASAIVHSAALADGTNPASITLEGVSIALVNNYPAATAGGIVLAAGIVAGDYSITAGNPITIDALGATTASSCRVSYTAAAAANTSPTIAISTEAQLNAGC